LSLRNCRAYLLVIRCWCTEKMSLTTDILVWNSGAKHRGFFYKKTMTCSKVPTYSTVHFYASLKQQHSTNCRAKDHITEGAFILPCYICSSTLPNKDRLQLKYICLHFTDILITTHFTFTRKHMEARESSFFFCLPCEMRTQ
jgi:hypothetical protein